jgi:hypothetical protein
MKRRIFSKGLCRLWLAGSSVLVLGGCGLSDAQLTSIAQSLVGTGLNSLLTAWLACLFPEVASTA